MAAPKAKGRAPERREPVFDVTPSDAESCRRCRSRPRRKSQSPRRLSPQATNLHEAPRKKRRKRSRSGGRWSIPAANLPIGALSPRISHGSSVARRIGGVVWIGAHLPPIQSLEIPKRPPSIKIVDAGGHLLAMRGDMGAAVPLKDLPKYVPQAFVAIEDRRFYSHHGVDPMGIARAMVANILHRGVSQGGSTLTQQLAKNLFLTQERTLSRKVQEVGARAVAGAHGIQQDAEILDLYLQPKVYFGAGRLRHRSGGAALLLKAGVQAHRRGGRDTRRPGALRRRSSRRAAIRTAPRSAPRSCWRRWWT